MKKLTFVASNTSNAVKAACTTRTGFFIALFLVPTAPHIDGAVPFVKGLKTFARCLGWIHGKGGTVFCCLSSHKISNKAMRNTEFTALEAIRERVSNVKDFLDTKKILNEVFIAYFLEHDFVEGFNSHRGDVTFLLILLNDLLDELLVESLQNPIQKPCNN